MRGWLVLAIAVVAACRADGRAMAPPAPTPSVETVDEAEPEPEPALRPLPPPAVIRRDPVGLGWWPCHEPECPVPYRWEHSAAPPLVTVGVAQVTPTLARSEVRRYVKRNVAKLAYCYETELLARPSLPAGAYVARFDVERDGRVTGARVSGVDPVVARCMRDVVAAIEFPRPTARGAVVIPLTANPPR